MLFGERTENAVKDWGTVDKTVADRVATVAEDAGTMIKKPALGPGTVGMVPKEVKSYPVEATECQMQFFLRRVSEKRVPEKTVIQSILLKQGLIRRHFLRLSCEGTERSLHP